MIIENNKIFVSKYQGNYRKNMSKKCNTDKSPFRCMQCDFTTTNNDNIKRHLKTHHDDPDFAIDVNSDSSSDNSDDYDSGSDSGVINDCIERILPIKKSLQDKDMPIFVRRKDYNPSKDVVDISTDSSSQSSESDSDFSNNDNDNDEIGKDEINNTARNIKTHTENNGTISRPIVKRPFYVCSICSFAGAQWDDLKLHMHGHTSKYIMCSECKYESSSKKPMILHMRKHTVDKQLACPECDYRGFGNNKLKVHNRKHHVEGAVFDLATQQEISIYCTQCNIEFVSHEAWVTHTNDHKSNCLDTDFQCVNYKRKFNPNIILENDLSSHNLEFYESSFKRERVDIDMNNEPCIDINNDSCIDMNNELCIGINNESCIEIKNEPILDSRVDIKTEPCFDT